MPISKFPPAALVSTSKIPLLFINRIYSKSLIMALVPMSFSHNSKKIVCLVSFELFSQLPPPLWYIRCSSSPTCSQSYNSETSTKTNPNIHDDRNSSPEQLDRQACCPIQISYAFGIGMLLLSARHRICNKFSHLVVCTNLMVHVRVG